MLKKILCLLIASMFLISNVYGADINDWSRGDGTDAVEGDETISTLDDQITNYLQNPLERLLDHYVRGCTITVTNDEVLTVSAGEVITTTAAGVHRMRQNTSTATVDNTAADVGGIDVGGAAAASTWYYVYAVADADATTFTLILSTSATNPTNGAALHYALIGCALTDGTSDWLPYFWSGDGNDITIMWDVPLNETTTVSSAAWSAALDCSSSMPSISTLGIFGLASQQSATQVGIWIRPQGSTWSTNDANGITTFGTSANEMIISGQRICMTDSSQQIQYYNHTGDTTTEVSVEGFQFIR